MGKGPEQALLQSRKEVSCGSTYISKHRHNLLRETLPPVSEEQWFTQMEALARVASRGPDSVPAHSQPPTAYTSRFSVHWQRKDCNVEHLEGGPTPTGESGIMNIWSERMFGQLTRGKAQALEMFSKAWVLRGVSRHYRDPRNEVIVSGGTSVSTEAELVEMNNFHSYQLSLTQNLGGKNWCKRMDALFWCPGE